MIRPALVLALAFVAFPSRAETIAKCTLQVGGKTYISGSCEFSPLGSGDFMISDGQYFAYVYVKPTPSGHWNGDPPGSHAHELLGELTREKGCWIGRNAKVCAER